jgi:hypothetical protein
MTTKALLATRPATKAVAAYVHADAAEAFEIAAKAFDYIADNLCIAQFSPNEDECEVAIGEAEAYLEESEAEHREVFAHVRERASVAEIVCGAYPNASKADLRAFTHLACDDIRELAPSRYALYGAMKHLRQTSKFLPSISEILPCIRAIQEDVLPESCFDGLRHLMKKVEENRLECAKRRKKRQAAADARKLAAGGIEDF